MSLRRYMVGLACVGLACACSAPDTGTPPESSQSSSEQQPTKDAAGPATTSPEKRALTDAFTVTEVASLDMPWAMTFFGSEAFVTEKTGAIWNINVATGEKKPVTGGPAVKARGQGGLGDIIDSPQMGPDGLLISYVEWEGDVSGAVVAEYSLDTETRTTLGSPQVVWRQEPKVTGTGHYGHRLALSRGGDYLFISSGDRQKFGPAQDITNNLGSIIRIPRMGGTLEGNPFAYKGGVSSQVWSYGHRNPLGLAVDKDGRLWEHEMGPQGGDELNLIVPGKNYGWPVVSNGKHYDGKDIPNHADGDGFEAPKVSWNPSVSPSGFMIYDGPVFPQWQGNAFLGALSGKALIRVTLDGDNASVAEVFDVGHRVREIDQDPSGNLYILTDTPHGKLLKLTPRQRFSPGQR